ncbi:hypothetical protein [Schlesneria paludicola]|uniref:hypothetical protein n=1 Tax=Schlesneria paludicola TaxID=360056 RepID=UPI00029AF902|nr:hypothetical protein [Schlesneria paludicola]
MDQRTWEQVEPQLAEMASELERLLASPDATKLRDMLAKVSRTMPRHHSASLNCALEIFDSQREKSFPVLTIGMGVSELGEVFSTLGESGSHRYIVNGEIEVVPQDRCPKCLDEWGFKWICHQCPHCDAQLGVNCWMLLDSDRCPNCEDGTVSADDPHCHQCGVFIDPKFVRWG